MRNLPARARSAFTLIELLVVMAIIGILAALLIVAVTRFSDQGVALQATSDIRNLTIAVNNFKAKYGVFPPSHIVLAKDAATIQKADPSGLSLAYLMQIWPRLFSDPTENIDWSGTGQVSRIYQLDGDQCLVFFLGGIPDVSNPARKGCLGFSSKPTNPTDQTGLLADKSGLVKGKREIWYQFDSSRLFIRQRAAAVPFYSYADPYFPYPNAPDPKSPNPNSPNLTIVLPQQPYAYFSSNKRTNGYNQSSSDCPLLLPNGAYFDVASVNPRHYFNPDSFQIISAGKNGLWGPGGPWSPGTATAIGEAGADDQANFYDAQMGVAQ